MIRRTAMTKFNKKLTNQISQAGSLMIEAMAMLALISLVTPTLYKKSAERTSELQDINTATHMRTLIKAVDNYVATNYDEMLKTISDGGYKTIDAADLTDYLPYGYDINSEVKNFGQPKIALHRQTNGITSYVELPKKADIGTMRAARIASMVGSNGGFVNGENAEGVGGIWSLDKNQLTGDLKFTGTPNSIVVTSSEAITSSTSAALENDKYLQRTKVESSNQKWRNTMATDLYMGGIASADGSDTTAMHKILGVDQLIIGSTNTDTHSDGLVVTGNNDEGSAWIEGALRASNNFLQVENNSFALGEEGTTNIMFANTDTIEMFGNSSDNGAGLVLNSNGASLTTDYDTTVNATLTSTGNTNLATNDGSVFIVGDNYIYADNNKVIFRGDSSSSGQLILEGDKYTTLNGNQTNINSPVSIGSGSSASNYKNPNPTKHADLNPQLYVQGNAYVNETLYSKKLETEEFDTLELHAGGSEFGNTNNRWLHATADGVKVTDSAGIKRVDIDANTTTLQNGASSLSINPDEIKLSASYENKTGTMSLAPASFTLFDHLLTANDDSRIPTVTIGDGSFNVYSTQAEKNVLSVQTAGTDDNKGTVNIDALTVDIKSKNISANEDKFTVTHIDANNNTRKKLEITETLNNNDNNNDKNKDSQVLINANGFLVNHKNGFDSILEVDTNQTDTSNKTKDGSVYIRKGAIEVEKSSDKGYAADEGYGYVSASRFVANNDNVSITYPTITSNNKDYILGDKDNYDKYMVNPAYTSVMHDIKLTTRGGARLSDILPDFINKGIYVVNNTFSEELCDAEGSCSRREEESEVESDSQWASPFLGRVPGPLCPPGYAKVITVNPSGFMMAQAGNLQVQNGKWYVNYAENLYNVATATSGIDWSTTGSTTKSINTPSLIKVPTDEDPKTYRYYLGYADNAAIPQRPDNQGPFSPAPLYFQQSTWLKSKVTQLESNNKPCSKDENNKIKCDNFKSWAITMGFIYPGAWYADIYKVLKNEKDKDKKLDSSEVAWNLFPVRAKTLEAYATVYCYFDNTGKYTDTKHDSNLVDPYDQLGDYQSSKSQDYINRLNDPTLKYNTVW